VSFVEPGEGYLACGWIGKGRLAEPDEIVDAVEAMFAPKGPLAGRRVLVTAGPTLEDIDPVRYVGNRSSGRMGFALASEAGRRGARVTLIAGPTSIEAPEAAELVRVRRAAEMHRAVLERAANADVVIMAAAVADYAPEQTAPQKISKAASDTMTLVLKKTPDILGELGRVRRRLGHGPLLVGFAAETESLVSRAADKLREKHADLIVANDVSRADSGFDADSNAVTILDSSGQETLPLQPKTCVAAAILDRVERLLRLNAAQATDDAYPTPAEPRGTPAPAGSHRSPTKAGSRG
jgi:phosphopantothenoylcysteine decarboxylase/phosphopantothenate--cysteine ligase